MLRKIVSLKNWQKHVTKRIKSFRKMLDANQKTAPLQRNVTIEEVGNAALFLCSPWASGITGEILYVDGGFNTVGMSSALLEDTGE